MDFSEALYDDDDDDDDDDDVCRDQSEGGTVSVRDRIHNFDVLFQPTPFYHLQRSSPWRASPNVAVSPTGSTAAGKLPVKAAVARYDGEMFRKQTPTSTQVNDINCLCVLWTSGTKGVAIYESTI